MLAGAADPNGASSAVLAPDLEAGIVVLGLDPGADVGVEGARGVGAALPPLRGRFGGPALDQRVPAVRPQTLAWVSAVCRDMGRS